MKIFGLIGLMVLGSTVAMANDGGMAVVTVDDISSKPVMNDAGQPSGVEIAIIGAGAKKLMQILPAQSGALQGYSKHVKGLAISAKDNKTDVIISCQDVRYVDGPKGFEAKPITPECTITLDTEYENEFGDVWDFDPKKEVCRK